jgi:hypothetical protein
MAFCLKTIGRTRDADPSANAMRPRCAHVANFRICRLMINGRLIVYIAHLVDLTHWGRVMDHAC